MKPNALVQRAFRRLFEHTDREILVYDNSGCPPAAPPCPEGWRLVRLEGTDSIPLLEGWHGLPDNKVRDFRHMLAEGELGYLCVDGDVVAGHVWAIVNRENSPINREYIRIYPGEAYLHYLHTYPDYRRRGVASLMGLYLLCDLYEGGDVRFIKASILSSNVPSLRLSETMPAKRVGRISFWRVMGIPFRRVTLNEDGRILQGVRW